MKFKKIFQGLTTLSCCIALLSTNITSICAYNVQYTIDNDPTSSSGFGKYINGPFSIITSSTCYNSDARRISSNAMSNSYYEWTYPSCGQYGSSYLTVQLEVYLNHSTFTDSDAKYYVQYSQYAYSLIGTINQRLAKAGWNTFLKKSIPSITAGGGFISRGLYVKPSGNPSQYTGADAIRITYF